MSEAAKNPMPAQHQERQPGLQNKMIPQPEVILPGYLPAGKLRNKVALISGGDSGIGRSVAVLFAHEGADIAFGYLDEDEDAQETVRLIEAEGRRCIAMRGDISQEAVCREMVEATLKAFGRLDILVNNAAWQEVAESLEEITEARLERTFRTNIYSYFFLAKAALPHLKAGSSIINTASVTAFRGSPQLIDYASTKGAIIAFTRSLALNLADKKIRVNAVAPGPIWTPLIPATMPREEVANFGADTPLERPGQPSEVATCYVFLASDDASYITGQTLHPNGGEIVNS